MVQYYSIEFIVGMIKSLCNSHPYFIAVPTTVNPREWLEVLRSSHVVNAYQDLKRKFFPPFLCLQVILS